MSIRNLLWHLDGYPSDVINCVESFIDGLVDSVVCTIPKETLVTVRGLSCTGDTEDAITMSATSNCNGLAAFGLYRAGNYVFGADAGIHNATFLGPGQFCYNIGTFNPNRPSNTYCQAENEELKVIGWDVTSDMYTKRMVLNSNQGQMSHSKSNIFGPNSENKVQARSVSFKDQDAASWKPYTQRDKSEQDKVDWMSEYFGRD